MTQYLPTGDGYKLTVVYRIMEYNSEIKTNQTLIYTAIWMNLKCIVPSKNNRLKGCILCDFIWMTFWKSNRKQISGCQGLGMIEEDDYV